MEQTLLFLAIISLVIMLLSLRTSNTNLMSNIEYLKNILVAQASCLCCFEQAGSLFYHFLVGVGITEFAGQKPLAELDHKRAGGQFVETMPAALTATKGVGNVPGPNRPTVGSLPL